MNKRLEKDCRGKINWGIYSLVAIILFHFINNLIWLHLDQTYLLDDAHWHFLFSLRVFDFLRERIFPSLAEISNNYFAFRWHGILVGYLTAPFYFIFGLTQDSAVIISSSIFLSILVLSIYGVGKTLFDKRTGLLSAFLVSMYPLVFNHMRTYMLDLPLTSMVVLSVFLLLKTEGFTSRKYSCLFAVISGLGLLIKFNFALFILGPLAIIIYKLLRKNGFKQTWRNMALVLFIIVLISFRFYGLKFWEVANRIYSCSWFYTINFYPRISFIYILQNYLTVGKDYLFFFLRDCFNNSVSPMLFILFSFGIFANNKHRGILFAWLGFPVFLLAFLFYYPDQSRYFMPVLPVLALISSAGIMTLQSVKLRRMFITLVVGLGCFQYFAISYRIYFLPKQIQMKIPLGHNRSLPIMVFKRDLDMGFRSGVDTFSYPARIEDKNEELLNEILENSNNLQNKINVFFMGSNVRIYQPFIYEAFVRKLPIAINYVPLSEEEKYKDQTLEVYNILRADYVVVTRGRRNQGAPLFIKKRLEESSLFFERNIGKFKLIKEFNFTNGDSLLLYKKKNQNYSRIVKNNLEVFFKDGIVRIVYHGKEITSNVGLEVSFTLEGKHYSNPYFQWSSEFVSHKSLIIYAKAEDLPLLMKWELSLENSRKIDWKVSIDTLLKNKIDNLYLTLFLTPRYTEWESFLGKKEFGSRNIHVFEEIRLLDSRTKSVILYSSKEKTLPKIMFSADNYSDVLPFVKWRNDLRGIGFYVKTKSQPLDKQNIFSGIISFK